MPRSLWFEHNLLVGCSLMAKPVVEEPVLLLWVTEVNSLGLTLAAHNQLQVRDLLNTGHAASHQVGGSSQPALKICIFMSLFWSIILLT